MFMKRVLPGKNGATPPMCLSPATVYATLLPLVDASDGDTRKAFLAMGFSDFPLLDLSQFRNVGFNTDGAYQWSLSMMVSNDLKLEKEFTRRLDSVNAVYQISFDPTKPEDSRRRINVELAKRTLLSNVLPAGIIDARTKIVLYGTSNFKAAIASKHAFDPSETMDLPFTGLDHVERNIPTMISHRAKRPYTQTNDHQFLQLSFADAASNWVIGFALPRDEKTTEFKDGRFPDIPAQSQFRDTKLGRVHLPKGRIESPLVNVRLMLEAQGYGHLFSNKADFSGAALNLMISAIFCKAIIEWNETSANASAAAVVVVTKKSVCRSEADFIAKRPFWVYIGLHDNDAKDDDDNDESDDDAKGKFVPFFIAAFV